MDRKKIAIATALLVLVITAGVALFFVFFRRAPLPEPVPPPTSPPTAPIPLPPFTNVAPPPTGLITPATGIPGTTAPGVSAIAQGGRTAATPLSTGRANFTKLGRNGRPQFYNSTDSRFYRVDARGQATPLSDHRFPGLRRVTWAPADDRAILEFPDGANVLFDFSTNEQVTLPTHWSNFSFAPDGTRIAGLNIARDRENRFLFEADPNGNAYRPIEPLGENADAVDVAWSPNNQVVAFSRTGETLGSERQQVLAIGRNGENLPGLTIEGRDFRPLWSPDGTRIVYSAIHSSNAYNPELWIVSGSGDTIGANRRRLRVQTWANKCTFADATTLYCAVPDTLERGYGLEPRLADRVPDSIQRIDITTGARSSIGRPETDTSITSLSIAPEGNALFYVAKGDGRLYEIKLR